jgi:hypothetical protein
LTDRRQALGLQRPLLGSLKICQIAQYPGEKTVVALSDFTEGEFVSEGSAILLPANE